MAGKHTTDSPILTIWVFIILLGKWKWRPNGYGHNAEIKTYYHQTSNISHTLQQNFNASRLVLQLSLPNPLKPGNKSRMKMYLEHRRQATVIHMEPKYCWL